MQNAIDQPMVSFSCPITWFTALLPRLLLCNTIPYGDIIVARGGSYNLHSLLRLKAQAPRIQLMLLGTSQRMEWMIATA